MWLEGPWEQLTGSRVGSRVRGIKYIIQLHRTQMSYGSCSLIPSLILHRYLAFFQKAMRSPAVRMGQLDLLLPNAPLQEKRILKESKDKVQERREKPTRQRPGRGTTASTVRGSILVRRCRDRSEVNIQELEDGDQALVFGGLPLRSLVGMVKGPRAMLSCRLGAWGMVDESLMRFTCLNRFSKISLKLTGVYCWETGLQGGDPRRERGCATPRGWDCRSRSRA